VDLLYHGTKNGKVKMGKKKVFVSLTLTVYLCNGKKENAGNMAVLFMDSRYAYRLF
jgi:hypothetical protein